MLEIACRHLHFQEPFNYYIPVLTHGSIAEISHVFNAGAISKSRPVYIHVYFRFPNIAVNQDFNLPKIFHTFQFGLLYFFSPSALMPSSQMNGDAQMAHTLHVQLGTTRRHYISS